MCRFQVSLAITTHAQCWLSAVPLLQVRCDATMCATRIEHARVFDVASRGFSISIPCYLSNSAMVCALLAGIAPPAFAERSGLHCCLALIIMATTMENMVRTALAGDPNALIQARMPGGLLYHSSADNSTGTDPPTVAVIAAFGSAVDKVLGTNFAHILQLRFKFHPGADWKMEQNRNQSFSEVYEFALMMSYQRQNQIIFDPETVTPQLVQNVRMTEQLLDQTKSALHGSDAVVELSRAGQPILAKLEAIEARLTQIENRSNENRSNDLRAYRSNDCLIL